MQEGDGLHLDEEALELATRRILKRNIRPGHQGRYICHHIPSVKKPQVSFLGSPRKHHDRKDVR